GAAAARAMLQPRLPRRSYLSAGLGHLPLADCQKLGRVGGSLQSRGELLFRRGWIEVLRGHGSVRQYGDDVIGNLHKSAIDVVVQSRAAGLDPHFAIAEPANQRAVVGENANFPVA